MPRLKTQPVNAYETLCSELDKNAAVPFGAWCALDGNEVLGYESNRDFKTRVEKYKQNAKACCDQIRNVSPENRDSVAYLRNLAIYLRDLSNYLSACSECLEQGLLKKSFQTLASNDGAIGRDIGLGFKSLCDRHTISLLLLDHGSSHSNKELRSTIGNLLAQYAVLENETRLLTEKGAESIQAFTPIEKNRSFARTGAKVGQLMGYAGYSEKDSELPLATYTDKDSESPLATNAKSIPSMPKMVKKAMTPQHNQYVIKKELFTAVEEDLLLVRKTALNKNVKKTPVDWHWSFTQGNSTAARNQGRLGLIGNDCDKWLASGRVLSTWFACARRNEATGKELIDDAVAIARKIASEQAAEASPEAGEELLAYIDALNRYWRTSGTAELERLDIGEALAPLFAAVLYCIAYRSNIANMGFNSLSIEAGLNTISPAPEPADQERPQAMPGAMGAEYITLNVTKIPKAATVNSGVESRARTYELGTYVLIGRAPNLVVRTSEHNENEAPAADFILKDPAVSRLALVLQTKDKLALKVLNKNTYLRNQPLDKGCAVEILPGDVLTLNGSESFYKIEISRLD